MAGVGGQESRWPAVTPDFRLRQRQRSSDFRLRIERVPRLSRWMSALVMVLSFLLALLFGGIVLFLAGENPLQVYEAMFSGAFGDWNGVRKPGQDDSPPAGRTRSRRRFSHAALVIIGRGTALGAIFATGLALFVIPDAPGWGMVPAMVAAGLLGGLWG